MKSIQRSASSRRGVPARMPANSICRKQLSSPIITPVVGASIGVSA